jgi:xanthine dehydrogenase YagR molybdenum-binding subunit
VPTAAAIANAVANAIGIRVADLPITPDRVLAALGKAPKETVTVRRERSQEIENAFTQLAAMPGAAWSESNGGCHTYT